MDKRKLYVILFWFLPILLTGCWDRVEIEERGFVIGTAIDISGETIEQVGKHELMMTNQFVVPGGLGSSSQRGGGEQKAFFNLSTTKESMFENSQKMASLTSRSPYYEHLKMIIISNEVAQVPGAFENVLDFFLRDHEMRRSTKVMISEGKAKNIIGIEPQNEKLPVMYLDSIAENAYKNAEMLQAVRIGDIHEHLIEQSSYVIPKITLTNAGAKIKGGAVFHRHNNRMIDTINEEETKGLNFITGKTQGGSIKTNLEGQLVVFEISGAKSRIEAKIKNKEDISFSILIQMEGKIVESFSNLDFTDTEILNKIEKKLAKEVERLANLAINKAQEELKTDFLRLAPLFRQQHYGKWRQIKDDWDHGKNYFAQSQINVEGRVIIRTSGSILSTETGG
ncbi:Ger(x)C family spore germination protein [Alkalihalobacillus sp. AL-G]|uniref:Ger(x)C family spore germination protein n=1 Tax=Alkalihalobacillus sp. AL-G TaxID=2926399 RepID=UPI00272CF63D|nr:Ger(x)C family spore germination protein [Alkalihalobacillus sp. AL-G]WLD92752.1 Ger(x)C family spore germination protein [Alkalihalobacillus sp. AL-G]